MLAYQWQAEQGTPVVFLHGLLGLQEDWAEVFAHLQDFSEIRPLAIDLPYHGKSAEIGCRDFADCRTLLHQVLTKTVGDQPFYLVGYSLGGRLALDYAVNQTNPNLQGMILEGANIGLATEAEKTARWQNDQQWAARFESEPLTQVLNDWYQQPVFAELSPDKRAEFVRKRQKNDGKKIAQMLRATSLAKQPMFEIPPCPPFPKGGVSTNIPPFEKGGQGGILFLIGERDHKFRQLAVQHQLPHILISKAGHNAHQANPHEFVQNLVEFIRRT